jgi:hypothetical protein
VAVALMAVALPTGDGAFAQRRPTPTSKATARAYEIEFKTGTRLFDAGDWADARAAFERAYAIDPRAILLFNIASTYRREGDLERAREHYVRFLAAGSRDRTLEEVARGLVVELDAAIVRRAAEAEAKEKATATAEAEARRRARAAREANGDRDGDGVPDPNSGDGEIERPAPARRPRTPLLVVGFGSGAAAGALLGWGLREQNRADEVGGRALHVGLVFGSGAAAAAVAVGSTIAAIALDEPSDGSTPFAARWSSWAVLAGVSGAFAGYFAYRFSGSRDDLARAAADPTTTDEVLRAIENRTHREGVAASSLFGAAAGMAAASLTALLLQDSGDSDGDGDGVVLAPSVGEGEVGFDLVGRF